MVKQSIKSKMRTFPLLVLALLLSTTVYVNAAVTYSAPLSVDGEEFEIGNLLEWSTATETNSQFFYIEKSLDGLDYENVGQVDAAGNSDDEVNYRYMDIQVTDKMAFYRLRQVDADGTESTSQAVMVVKQLENKFMLVNFSNITVNKLFEVTIDVMEEGEMEYSLVSYKGDVVFEAKQKVVNGLNDFQINLEDEKEGNYKVVFKMGSEEEKLNIIKLEDELKKKPNVASKKSNSGG